MSDNIKISIIIPFYNIAKELFDICIQSIRQQIYKNYEIIIINDGSSTEYSSFLEEYCGDNVKIIHKENEGVSKARNIGIVNCTGEYLTFVDGDDSISPYMLEEAASVIDKTNCDIVIGKIKITNSQKDQFVKSNRIIVYNTSDKRTLLLNSIFDPELLMKEQNGWQYIMQAPVAKIFKKEILEDCPFPNGVSISEDTIWNYNLFSKCNDSVKIAFLQSGWYLYFQNEKSTLHSFKADLDEQILTSIKALNKTVWEQEGKFSCYYIGWIIGKIQQLIECYLLNPENKLLLLEKIFCLKSIMKEPEIRIVVQNGNSLLKQKIKFAFFKSGLAVWYYKQKQRS